jgi:nucleoside 2-deoxyribosyltransferase
MVDQGEPHGIVGRSVYVAGPFGFTEPGKRYLYDVVLPRLDARGFLALDPWVAGDEILGPVLAAEPRDHDAVIAACAATGDANAQMIHAADAVLALLDGCDLDSGTCAEVGYAAGLGKPVIGLRTDTRWAGDVPEVPINLQVQHFLEYSGGSLETDLDEALYALERALGLA